MQQQFCIENHGSWCYNFGMRKLLKIICLLGFIGLLSCDRPSTTKIKKKCADIASYAKSEYQAKLTYKTCVKDSKRRR